MNTLPYDLFDELWYRYKPKIYAYFRRQFDEATAEDLCQQTYLNAWKHLSIHPQKSIKAAKSWLFAIAKNVRNDYLRYISLHSMNFNYSDINETVVPVEVNIDERINIQKAIEKLCQEDKELLAMAEHLSSREIGSVLGISASAVRSRISKAKEKLKINLSELDID